ncbi:MAG: isochorismatase family cysteine hydrolase [Acidimicrobiales bacterium]
MESPVGNQALLIMDMQNGIVERYVENVEPLFDTLSAALGAARANGTTVVFVRVAFREGAPEVSSKNKSFAALAGSLSMDESAHATKIHERLAPGPGEVLVTKRRVSAFAGSDLDVVLRAKNIDSLVLSGIATSGVVLSTLRQAADLDFALTVLSDGCADQDPEVHRLLTEKVFVRQANVLTTQEWINTLTSA